MEGFKSGLNVTKGYEMVQNGKEGHGSARRE